MDQSEDFRKWKRNLPHFEQRGAIYYLTFSTYRRRVLTEQGRNSCFCFMRKQDGTLYELIQLAVMPDHVHILCSIGANPLNQVLQKLKGSSARFINIAEGMTGSKVWQDESWDRIVRNERELRAMHLYIEFNSVEAGLANKPQDYPWYFSKFQTERS